jgi:hypothetical protein
MGPKKKEVNITCFRLIISSTFRGWLGLDTMREQFVYATRGFSRKGNLTEHPGRQRGRPGEGGAQTQPGHRGPEILRPIARRAPGNVRNEHRESQRGDRTEPEILKGLIPIARSPKLPPPSGNRAPGSRRGRARKAEIWRGPIPIARTPKLPPPSGNRAPESRRGRA